MCSPQQRHSVVTLGRPPRADLQAGPKCNYQPIDSPLRDPCRLTRRGLLIRVLPHRLPVVQLPRVSGAVSQSFDHVRRFWPVVRVLAEVLPYLAHGGLLPAPTLRPGRALLTPVNALLASNKSGLQRPPRSSSLTVAHGQKCPLTSAHGIALTATSLWSLCRSNRGPGVAGCESKKKYNSELEFRLISIAAAASLSHLRLLSRNVVTRRLSNQYWR